MQEAIRKIAADLGHEGIGALAVLAAGCIDICVYMHKYVERSIQLTHNHPPTHTHPLSGAGQELVELWLEYEDCSSPEARVVKDFDKCVFDAVVLLDGSLIS